MERDAVARLGRIFTGNENTGEMRVVFSEYGVLRSPATDSIRYVPRIDSERFDDIATGETAFRLVILLIENDAGLPRTAMKVDRLGHQAKCKPESMASIVFADVAS